MTTYAINYAAILAFTGVCPYPPQDDVGAEGAMDLAIETLETWRDSFPRVLCSNGDALNNAIHSNVSQPDGFYEIRNCLNYIYDLRFPDSSDLSTVSILQKNCNHELRQTMRLGKFLRKILSESVPDSKVEEIAELFLNRNCPKRAVDSLYFKKGDSQLDFHNVYSARVFNGNCDSSFASLTGSCMQGSARQIRGQHPAKAYGSGDFWIYSAWRKAEGTLAARVIVAKDCEAATPIYASATYAGRALRAYVEKDCDQSLDAMTDSLSGYSLAAVSCGNDRYLMPYLDCRESVSFCGDSFSIGHGDIDTSPEGYVEDRPQAYCDSCDEYHDDDDISYLDNYGESVCGGCLRRYYTRSDLSDNYIRDSDLAEYMDSRGTHREAGSDELESHGGFAWVESASMYVDLEYTVTTECGELYTVDDIGDSVSEVDGLYYVTDSKLHVAAVLQHEADVAKAELDAALNGLQREFAFLLVQRMAKVDSALARISRATALVPVPAPWDSTLQRGPRSAAA